MAYGSGNKFRSKKVKAELKGSYEDGAKLIFYEMSAQEFKDKIASEMEKAEADPKAAQKAEKSAGKMKKKLDKDEEKSVKMKAFYEHLQQQGMHIVLNVGESFIY